MEKITAQRGTKDILPDEVYKWHYVEGIAREVARIFGFSEIRPPTFEDINLFIRGVGDTTDVVSKEMYDFIDKGGRHIALRPEGTASVVRALIEHSLDKKGLPIKLYYIAPNFRYEKPQSGRLREHHQFGIEIFGSAEPSADVEVISLGYFLLTFLGIHDLALFINSCGCPECRPNYQKALVEYFSSKKDTLCDTCNERLFKNPMRILDCKSEICKTVCKDAPKIIDYLCPTCSDHFEKVKTYLTELNISFKVNPFIVRGLDYYTNTVFEFQTTSLGAQNTICGGGRYNGLVSSLGGDALPGVGFGSGLERIIMTMEQQDCFFEKASAPDIFIATIGESAVAKAISLTNQLRMKGKFAEYDIMGRSLKAQMKFADKIGARFTLTIGDTEIETNLAKIKNMSSGEMTEIGLTAEDIGGIIEWNN